MINLVKDPYTKIEEAVYTRLREGLQVEDEATVRFKKRYTLLHNIIPCISIPIVLAYFPYYYRKRRNSIARFLRKAAEAKKSENLKEIQNARKLFPKEFYALESENEVDDLIDAYGDMNEEQRNEEEIRILREIVIQNELPIALMMAMFGIVGIVTLSKAVFRKEAQDFIKNEDLKYLMYKKISWKLLPPGSQEFVGDQDVPRF